METPWFIKIKKCRSPKLRLVCFPYAGGNAYVFNDWDKIELDNVEILAVQYPGRGSRFNDPLIRCGKQMGVAIAQELARLPDLPTVFYGHSNGAFISFETALELKSVGKLLEHQFISAKRAPNLPANRKIIHTLDDNDFLQAVFELGGTPEEFLKNQDLMNLFLPVLKADFCISETYQANSTSILDNEATLVYGVQDPGISEADMLAWASFFSSELSLEHIDDGHFFINSSRDQVLAIVSAKLKSLQEEMEYLNLVNW